MRTDLIAAGAAALATGVALIPVGAYAQAGGAGTGATSGPSAPAGPGTPGGAVPGAPAAAASQAPGGLGPASGTPNSPGLTNAASGAASPSNPATGVAPGIAPSGGSVQMSTGTGTSTAGMSGTGSPGQTGASGNTAEPAAGSEPTGIRSTHFNVAQTIAAALASSTDYANAVRTAEIDRKRADEAAAAARPSLAANASATRFDAPTNVALGNNPPIQVHGNHTELVSINLADRLDIAGQVHAAQSQAELQSKADQYVAQQIRNGRVLRAQMIYYDLLRARHQVQVADAALQNALQQQSTAQKLYEGGVGQKIDFLRARTQVATAQQGVIQARSNAAIAETNFNDLVGQPLGTAVEIDDVPGVTVGNDTTAATAVGAPTSGETYYTPPAEAATIDLDKGLTTAETSRPEIQAAELTFEASQRGITLARAGLAPDLELSAAGNYYPTTSFQAPRQRVGEVTAALSIPLYDGGATQDRVAEARLRTENAKQSLGSARSDVALDVRQAYLNVVTAANQITSANSALQQAVAARQLAQIRYEGQVGLYLEVTDAEQALVQAQTNQVGAVYSYLVARAAYSNALGTPEY